MSHEELIAKVRSRVAMARRLADATHDPKTAAELRQMADDGEKDLAELESEIRTIEIKPKPEWQATARLRNGSKADSTASQKSHCRKIFPTHNNPCSNMVHG